jgi:hypothetical protein
MPISTKVTAEPANHRCRASRHEGRARIAVGPGGHASASGVWIPPTALASARSAVCLQAQLFEELTHKRGEDRELTCADSRQSVPHFEGGG